MQERIRRTMEVEPRKDKKFIRRVRKYGVRRMAADVGISIGAVSRFINGKSVLSGATFDRITNRLDKK